MSRRILVTVSPGGEITVEADGFQGSGCQAATRAMENALGAVSLRTRKPEFHRPEIRRAIRPENRQRLGEGGGQ